MSTPPKIAGLDRRLRAAETKHGSQQQLAQSGRLVFEESPCATRRARAHHSKCNPWLLAQANTMSVQTVGLDRLPRAAEATHGSSEWASGL